MLNPSAELNELRRKQREAVMPLIGPLLDAWEAVPNDFRSMIDDECPALATILDRIWQKMER
ncbi:MAG TPA: hypothetical protein VFR24_27770 [Candidatus Angelobacter sp.]|nr:hypothetical protein [Candidatus Angelobacter sp.]